ncbi:acyltransferase [Lederbergia graminis]|uniref:Acyltransferase n=1 Tax=Lederbergia graminis TaxID=735518 RepID=A0ABW0LIM9_9BACI
MSTNGTQKVRKSNFELLRIISMLMIVVLHTGTHGLSKYVDVETLGTYNEFFYYFIRSLAIIAVNVYVFISGYFLVKSKFKWRRLLLLFLETSFISSIIYLGTVWFEFETFTFENFIKSLFSIYFRQYWFVTVYFVLYLISPFLNLLIENLSKRDHRNLLIILFVISAVWQFFFSNNFLAIMSGYSIVYFIFLYILAAYIRFYDFIFKDFKKNIYLISFVLLALLNSFLFLQLGKSNVMDFINEIHFLQIQKTDLFDYNSPIVLAMSYCLFLYFKHLNITSRIINFSATYVFGVYLIHEQPSMRQVLWEKLGIIENVISTKTNYILVKYLTVSIVVFLACWLASLVLSSIYYYLTRILSKPKVSNS